MTPAQLIERLEDIYGLVESRGREELESALPALEAVLSELKAVNCPECGQDRPGDDRVQAGLKCAQCAYYRQGLIDTQGESVMGNALQFGQDD